MFNVTVINIKDVMKYLFSLILVIVIIVLISKFLYYNEKKQSNTTSDVSEKISLMSQSSLIECLDETVPAIEETNRDESTTISENESNSEGILNKIFQVELADLSNNANETQSADETQESKQDSQEEETEETEETTTEVVTENPITVSATNTYGAVQIKNETSYSITNEMLTPDIEVDNSNIIIYHTHTCESYTATEQYSYEATGTYRTTDLNYSVARVGDELTNYLTEKGYNVVHDKTYHDYPAYTGSYTRSLETVQNILQSTSADVVIDLHRDAVGSNSDYAPTVKIGEEYAAQLMFVIGTDGGGLWHPNWNQNLKFAVKIQEKAEEMYPGLFKPIILRNSRYNQHVSKAATIIEVGATGNTLEQCLTSMKYLSNVISEVMK